MVNNNNQVWFDILAKTLGVLNAMKDKRNLMNGMLATYRVENKRLRQERNEAHDDCENALDERDATRNQCNDALTRRDIALAERNNALDERDDARKSIRNDKRAATSPDPSIHDLDDAEDEIAEHKQTIESLTAERDQAVYNLQQQQQRNAAAESQTQQSANFFASRLPQSLPVTRATASQAISPRHSHAGSDYCILLVFSQAQSLLA
ncbi:hypothetical protein Q7P36_007744 [Cladosporium allicinum]